MSSRGGYNPLDTEMYTLFVESRLVSPFAGNVIIEVSPRERISNIIQSYLQALQSEDKTSGLAVYDAHNCKLDWSATIESQGIKEGSKLFIGYDRSSLLKPLHIAVIGISTIIIAIVLIITTSALFGATGGTVPFDYGIVIDAGSTHTEVFLYQWSGDKDHGTGNVHQRDSCEYEVGIASGADPDNILSCVYNITKSVPKGSLPVLYLGATAGMRILNITSPKETGLILTSLKYALSTSQTQVKTIAIIQGEEEALFSWISTNFLFHSLTNYEGLNTYGALDLGGASTQYAYAVHNESFANDSDITSLKLYGRKYLVKSASFLCYGYLEAMNRHEAMLFMNNVSATINDPCLPSGYLEKMNAYSFSEKPCISNQKFNEWLQKRSISDELLVKGASDYSQCQKDVQKLLDRSFCEESGFKQCLPNTNLNLLNMQFTAFSGFYYVVHFLNGSVSLDEFRNSTKNWCGLSWEEIQSSQPKAELEHVLRYCFAATYIIELFTKKYGFDSNSWNRIDFIKKIEDADIGWTLGYMIYATNAIPEELPSPPVISASIFISLVCMGVAMIVIAAVIVKKYADLKICNSNSHSRLLEV